MIDYDDLEKRVAQAATDVVVVPVEIMAQIIAAGRAGNQARRELARRIAFDGVVAGIGQQAAAA